MSDFYGKNLKIEFFGSSHEPTVGARVFGLPDFSFSPEKLNAFLSRRKPNSQNSTARVERDEPVIKPIANGGLEIVFKNENVVSSDYADCYSKPRPSHADIGAYYKYGTLDFSGGGRFSGRMTAPLCAVGGIALQYLKTQGVEIAAYISAVGGITATSYKTTSLTCQNIIKTRGALVPSLSHQSEIDALITKARQSGDSVGGTVECVVEGLPKGLGDSLFGGLESKLSYSLFAIPAVKAVEFGLGVGFSDSLASAVNDGMTCENGIIKFTSNNCGGVYGGVVAGDQLTFAVTFKPTPSIPKPQTTVDLVTKQTVTITTKGRHDSCIVLRAAPIVESAAAIAVLDEILASQNA